MRALPLCPELIELIEKSCRVIDRIREGMKIVCSNLFCFFVTFLFILLYNIIKVALVSGSCMDLFRVMISNWKLDPHFCSYLDGYDGDDDETARTFRDNLLRIAAECLPKMKGSWWYRRSDVEIRRLFEHVWAFGPPNARGNLLLNGIFERNDLTVFSKRK